ncbi:LPS export ABC transporter ATP-binding protein [Thermovibrio ammonificans]|uniref:Lipopolysaccharide export system ATP-binding protein LptB n=1 Tax=Thermovibrio ammonificans (strain DSM 15698 / JCM 12110 / HB-1) TaxID=648996 RepID=E8T2M0_THEA1|nr:LPS export ABC transporter ATP-binding protein [Thermovibrio ammonificans]ADU97115.1 ABC transporter related protein [Thermovibrio ammonificans HB-1]
METVTPPDLNCLRAERITKRYGKKTVVDNVTVEVMEGEVVGLLGPNGAGKTTTFYCIVGLVKPDGGRVLIGEEDVTELPTYERALKGLSYLPQEPSVFRKLTVEDNIKAVLEMHGYSKGEIEEKTDSLLNRFGIAHLRKQKAASLSGGERRRLEIARALTINPKFLLLDEPFAGIDPIAVSDIQGLIKELKEMDIGILITDHNVRETLKIIDRAYIIAHGKVIASGKPHEVANQELVREIYLGEDFSL